jgi:spermidine/putrescine transport system permease protein
MNRSRLPATATIMVMAFFYLPILLLVANSFNRSRFGVTWTGFTFDWYRRLIEREDILAALGRSLTVATVAAFGSMLLGTAAAFALHRYRSRIQSVHRGLIYVPLVLPEVLMGMSLLSFFVAIGQHLSLLTIMMAHLTFCISYVTLVVMARLQDFDDSLIDAARDLGATRMQTFRRITLPLIAPGILAGGLLAFTLSIDDFVVTSFVSGAGTDTLPVKIAGMMKLSRDMPVINALSSLLLILTFAVVWTSQRLLAKK